MLFTGDSKRWSDRPKIWKEGWRNLHHAHPSAIEAEVLFEGQGTATVGCTWDAGAALEGQKASRPAKGKPKTSLQELGWREALVSYRPFLSYNELGSLLDEGPSKLYDALSLVLGLEDLVTAQAALAKSRLERQQPLDAADQDRQAARRTPESAAGEGPDDRASACLDALTSKSWGLPALDAMLAAGTVPPADQDISILTRAVSSSAVDPERVLSGCCRFGTPKSTSRRLSEPMPKGPGNWRSSWRPRSRFMRTTETATAPSVETQPRSHRHGPYRVVWKSNAFAASRLAATMPIGPQRPRPARRASCLQRRRSC